MFNIRNKMLRGIGHKTVGSRATPAPALVKAHNAVACGVKPLPVGGVASATWASMQHQSRDTSRVSTFFDINNMAIANIQHMRVEGLEGRVKGRKTVHGQQNGAKTFGKQGKKGYISAHINREKAPGDDTR